MVDNPSYLIAILVSALLAASASAGEAPAYQPPGYAPPVLAGARQRTHDAATTPHVDGEPRVATGHPCTIWDRADIERYRALLKTSDELRDQLAALRKDMDKRIARPVEVPRPESDGKGGWKHLDERQVGKPHNRLSIDIANLGAAYVLTDDARYGDYAKRLLLAYADAFPHYGIGARPGFTHDPSMVFDQGLGDAIWLIQIARGYDLIHDLPSMTADERRHIEDDLVRASGRFLVANRYHLSAPTNWSAICAAAILTAGAACDDQALIDKAMWGANADKPDRHRWWTGDASPEPGGIELHVSATSIDVDGMWAEGAMGYQFMALQALICDAEILWHRGIDLYRHRGGALKQLFDSPLRACYPDLTTPAIHDSYFGNLVSRETYLYEFAYQRYRDPRYLPLLRATRRHLATEYQQFAVSTLYGEAIDAGAVPPAESVDLDGVGYAILRPHDARGPLDALIDYGPDRSHGHPDKLQLDVWVDGDRLAPDPGMVWYEEPLYRRWYRTTVAHDTLCVDQKDQADASGEELAFAAGDAVGVQRSRCARAYAGVLMDRAVFATRDYVADCFAVAADQPRTLDLCWHVRGELGCDLALTPTTLDASLPGYQEIAEPRHASVDAPYALRFARGGHAYALVAAGAPGTEVILGLGHLADERPTTVLQRRHAASTLYGNALDLSGAVRAVEAEGGIDAGAALLRVRTADGDDVGVVSFAAGEHRIGGVATDAVQAFVVRRGGAPRALVLAGGTTLTLDGARLARSAPGIVVAERRDDGSWLVANRGDAAEISLAVPGLGATANRVGDDGSPGAAVAAQPVDGALRIALAADERIAIGAAR